jgi:D-alanyl-lipoteichoic acid acyltransferase DltB (MBOAT superfamily)
MNVPSPDFLAFSAVAALLYNASRAIWWRRMVLLIANGLFLASFSRDITAFLPFAGFLLLGYVAQQSTRNGRNRRLFPVLLIVTIAAFVWLKRYSFIPSAAFLPFPYLLIGLSYVFFRVVQLIVDSAAGDVAEPVDPLSYLNYTLNFTSLVSGPIQRYQDYRAMEIEPLPLDLPVAGRALERIIIGYFKVAILSMLLSQAQHDAIDALQGAESFPDSVWLGVQIVALYPLYLYCNFSGYVDVVIGVARFFRIALPENFDRPFSAGNFLDFWSQWHITLSHWLKTYVFTPLMLLMMKRVTAPSLAPFLAVIAFFVTFFLVGIWHGQTSVFVVFGFLQGLGVSGNKLYQVLMAIWLGKKRYKELAKNGLYHAVARGLTFAWFAFTLIFFWGEDWNRIDALGNALGWAGGAAALAAIWLIATVVLSLWEALRARMLAFGGAGQSWVMSHYVRTAEATALAAVTLGILLLLNAPAPDIVYKAF